MSETPASAHADAHAHGTPDWLFHLADAVDEMVWLWDAASGSLLHANEAFMRLLGRSPVPEHARDLLMDRVVADDAKHMRVMRARLPAADYVCEYRLDVPTSGGKATRVARVRERAFGCTGPRGEPWVVHVGRDISWQVDTTAQLHAEITRRTDAERNLSDATARRQAAARALEESEAKYRKVVENVNEGILVTALGRILYANPKALAITGLDEATALSTPFTEFIHPDDRERVLVNHTRRLQGEPVENDYHFRVLHADGRVRWLEISAVLFEWQGTAATLNFLTDVTERLLAEEEMRNALARERELSEMKSRFVAVTSHEIRTPLAGILSSVEVLDSYGSQLPAEDRQEIVGQIRDAVARMNGMVEQVLVTSKIESGHFPFAPQPHSVPQLLVQVASEMDQSHAGASRIAMRCDGLEGRRLVDAQLVRHILLNLLSNALKYSPPDSPVECSAASGEAGSLVFRVQDRGIGIPPQDLPRLFHSFHRGANVGTIPGTGIGLHIVKECVELHHGAISVDSEPGRGTVFHVRLHAPMHSSEP